MLVKRFRVVQPVPMSTPVEHRDTLVFVDLNKRFNDFLRECLWYFEMYSFQMLEEHYNSLLIFAHLDLFLALSMKQLTTGFWMFDGNIFNPNLDYKKVIPVNILKRLTVNERVRLSLKKHSDYERIEFRLLYFIIWDDAINNKDVFVIFANRQEEDIVEYLVKSRAIDSTIELVSNYLSVNYRELQSKCQTYRNLLKCCQGLFQQEEEL